MFSPKSNHQYPILLCPDRWYKAVSNPDKLEFTLPKPKPPSQYGFPLQTLTIVLLLVIIASLVSSIFLPKKRELLLPIGIVGSIFCLPLVWRDYSDFSKEQKRSVKLKERYQRDLTYYQQEYAKFQQMQKRLNQLSRSELIKEISLQQLKRTVLPEEGENPKIGLSERDFYRRYLVKYFGDNICTDRMLPNENNDRPYYPDFVFTIPELRLYIDIEIDEPYSPLKGNPKPKHYQGKDDDRDQFFLSQGWFIIRFSERQIIEQPDACCKTIAQCVREIVQDDRFLEKFTDTPDLQPEEQWTEAEAQQMILRNERLGYLPRSLFQQDIRKKEEQQPVSQKQFIPSSYQVKIFEFVEKGKGNGLVNAVAGSGKSTTLIQAAKLLPTRNALFVAFNKSIAEELKKKLNNLMEAKTIHALGLQIVKSELTELKTDEKKYKTIVAQLCPQLKTEEKFLLEQLINYARYTLTDPEDGEKLALMAEHYNLDLTYFDQAMPHLSSCLAKGIEVAKQKKQVDFTDMIWLPNVLNLKTSAYDWMFVDECQDLSACQLELILKCLSDRGRILFVGDPFQAIYGFSGADCESVEKIKERVNAVELPLSICYRCPKSHIELAKEIVPQIEAREDAPEGIVEKIDRSTFFDLLQVSDERKTLVIGRRTAPLINIYLSLKQEGISAILKGGEIKQELIDIVRKVGQLPNFNFSAFLKCLRIYFQDRSEQIRQGSSSKQKLDYLTDQIKTIESIYSRGESRDIDELIDEIEDSFRESSATVTLCTVHKAKGLEADRVFIIAPNEIPLIREGQKDWEKQQEIHLKYVALTRSRSELYFVNLDSN